MSTSLTLIVWLITRSIGGLPTQNYSRNWGYSLMSIVGVILVVVIVMALLGKL